MRFTTLEIQTLSTDSIHTLYGKIYIPIGTPKGIVQIIHGMSEHMELYDEFMSELAKNGYVSVVYDQLGHGKTAGGKDDLGFFSEKDGDEILIGDAQKAACEFLSDYSGIPHILFGHSMGSFIARLCAQRYPEMCDMLILSGTGGHQRGSALGLALTKAGDSLHGRSYRPDHLQKMFLDYCNMMFRDDNNLYAWTTSDTSVQKEHFDDPKYNFVFSYKAMNDVVALSEKCSGNDWYDGFPVDLPTLIISGEKDPVGDYGRGVIEIYKKLVSCGANDVSLKIYKGCRHELLHEKNRREVTKDIIKWLSNRV